MLDDKDRIFTNLYGFQPWGLKAAQAARRLGRHQGADGASARTRSSRRSRHRACAAAAAPASRPGMKWSFMPKEPKEGRPNFLVINADESEPGSCKDREIIRHDPHKLIEGALIAGFAMRARAGYIYIRGEFIREAETLEAAVQEAYDAGLLGKNAAKSGYDFDLFVHRGAGAYICGEETAMLESLEGKKGMPRLKPPFPAGRRPLRLPDHGQQCRIDRRRADHPAPRRGLVHGHRPREERGHQALPDLRPREQALRGRGRDVGPVPRADRPPCRRHPRRLGQSARGHPRRLVGAAGAGRTQIIDAPMDFDGLKDLGSGLGTAAVIVMDKSTDIVKAISRISYFYKHESCGQCTPCREGTGWMWRVMERLRRGQCRDPRDRHALGRHQAGRGPHHLRARRRRRLADPGPDPPFPARARAADRGRKGGAEILQAAE